VLWCNGQTLDYVMQEFALIMLFKLVCIFPYDRQLLNVTQVNLCTYCDVIFHCIVGQMYMLSCDGHIDTSDVSVALFPPGLVSLPH